MTSRSISRRDFLVFGPRAAGGLLFLGAPPAQAATFTGLRSDPLPGRIAGASDIDQFISELNNKLSQISLANEQALQAECDAMISGAQQSVKASQAALASDLDEANKSALISSVGTALSGISLALLFVSTSPLWLVSAGGLLIVAATVPFSLSLGNASQSANPVEGVVVATSFTSGRLSLVASSPGVSTTARLTGRTFGALAVGIDAAFAIRDWISVSEIHRSLQNLEVRSQELHSLALRLRSDREACRETRLTQIRESIEGLTYLRNLTATPTNTSNSRALILP